MSTLDSVSKPAASSSAAAPTDKPEASALQNQLHDLGEEMLRSAKRLATDPEFCRKIQKQLVELPAGSRRHRDAKH